MQTTFQHACNVSTDFSRSGKPRYDYTRQRLPVWFDSISTSAIGMADPEDTGVAVRILFLSRLQAKK